MRIGIDCDGVLRDLITCITDSVKETHPQHADKILTPESWDWEQWLPFWTNDETDLSIYLENPRHWIEYVKNGNGSKYNVLVMIEPISLTKHETSTDTEVYDIIKLKENYELFDMIFTTYPEYSDIDSRFKYYPGGLRSYIKKGHWGIYKKLENTCFFFNK